MGSFSNNQNGPDVSSSSFARTMNSAQMRMSSPFKKEKHFTSTSRVSVNGSSSSLKFDHRGGQSRRSFDFVTKPRPSPTKRMTPRSSDNGMNLNTSTPTHGEKSPKHHYFSSPSLKNGVFHTPNKKLQPSPCASGGDRFIPNRSHLRIDLCRASIVTAEKKRLEFIEKKTVENDHNINTVDNNDQPANSNNDMTRSSSEILTPIQSEYRARMKGALLNVPVDVTTNDSVSSTTPNATRNNDGHVASIMENSISSRSSKADRYNLAYAPVPDLDNENIMPNKMLSFSGIVNDGSFSSLSSDKSKMYDQNRVPAVVTPDPYSHDQLRVLDRSAFGRFSTSVDSFQNDGMSAANKVTRRINTAPTRILDAPELVDDYYLNLISWGEANILAVALGQCVYLWNSETGDINHLLTLPGVEDFVTSVKWANSTGNSNYLAVGTNDGPVQLWDTEAMRKVRSLGGHAARVGSLDWNQHWLSSGGRDSIIIQHDVRSAQHITSTYAGHTQEVCGLAWSEDGTTLASGGNENYLCIWDAAMSTRRNNSRGHNNHHPPRLTLTQHLAAVKALAWCPFHRGLLASGGGTADRSIKFWNSNSGAVLNSIDTGSQVCSLLWSKHQRELCSSHGFSENQLILWRYPNMTKIQEFKGHTARVSKRHGNKSFI